MNIGPYEFHKPIMLAPMAGVTDRPFRQLCKKLGADLAVSEMVTCDPKLRKSAKTQLRLNHSGETKPIAVQIAGGDAAMLAEAARVNAGEGAEIIDINMGCPAKKVCRKAAGSALLKDEALVAEILQAVVAAVTIPVTLKIRTGWCPKNRNAVTIARLAESLGVQAITVHGRTRACRFQGEAEYDTIKSVKQAVKIPVIANGDIYSAQKAQYILEHTGADAIMIGRAAQGNPWIFREVGHFFATGHELAPPSPFEVKTILLQHLQQLYSFYGEYMGVRIARKHVSWYCRNSAENSNFPADFNSLQSAAKQLSAVDEYFNKVMDERDN